MVLGAALSHIKYKCPTRRDSLDYRGMSFSAPTRDEQRFMHFHLARTISGRRCALSASHGSGAHDHACFFRKARRSRHRVSPLTRWRARLGRGFLSPDGAALMYAYDDLGADVVGAAPERLKPLFDTFPSWLLGHDMQRIRRAFAAGSELGES